MLVVVQNNVLVHIDLLICLPLDCYVLVVWL